MAAYCQFPTVASSSLQVRGSPKTVVLRRETCREHGYDQVKIGFMWGLLVLVGGVHPSVCVMGLMG